MSKRKGKEKKMVRLVKRFDKHWGVEGEIPHKEFNELLCNKAGLNAFHQAGKPGEGGWCFIEFWQSNQSLILEECLKIFPNLELEE